MKANEIKALHEAVYSQYDLLLQYSNRAADAAMNITKAQEVKQAYDVALKDNLYSRVQTAWQVHSVGVPCKSSKQQTFY